MKTKVIYILPEYNPEAPTHHVHLFELLEHLGKKLDILLLVEKSVSRPEIQNLRKIFVSKNFFDRIAFLFWARLLGYKNVYVHYSYWGAILASIIFRPTGGRVFYWHCEVYDQFFSKFNWSWAVIRKKLLDEYLMVAALRLVNYLVTGTKTVGEFYQKQFSLSRSKVEVIPNWVNLERFTVTDSKTTLRKKLGLPQDKKIVVFAHRLAPRKGADLLPGIVSAVVDEVPSVFFLVAGGGGGTLGDWLAKEFSKRKLHEHVYLSSGIPNMELPDYLSAADLFIMPSRQEGFPRILIECMACGLPFVATNVGGTSDIVNKSQKKFLVPATDQRLFIDKSIELLRGDKLREQISRSGLIQVQQYSLVNVAAKFARLFR